MNSISDFFYLRPLNSLSPALIAKSDVQVFESAVLLEQIPVNFIRFSSLFFFQEIDNLYF